jgi:hypothetical protein
VIKFSGSGVEVSTSGGHSVVRGVEAVEEVLWRREGVFRGGAFMRRTRWLT